MQIDSPFQSRGRISAAERSQLVARYRSSGMTQAEFAEQNGINVHTLRQWIYRGAAVERQAAAPMAAGLDLREVPLSTLLPPAWAAEVVLPCGASVRLNANASPELIAELFAQLSSPC